MVFNHFLLAALVYCLFPANVVSKNEIILKPGLKISSFFNNFSTDLTFPPIDEITMYESYDYFADESAILNKTYEFKLPVFLNASTEVLGYNMNIAKLNTTFLTKGLNYKMKSTYPSSLVTSYPKKVMAENIYEANPNYKMEINYTAPDFEYSKQWYQDIKINTAKSFHNLIFGVRKNVKNNLYVYQHEGRSLIQKRLSDYVKIPDFINMNDTYFESIHMTESDDEEYSILALQYNTNLSLFKLERDFKDFKVEVKISYLYTCSHESLGYMKIQKILYTENYLFLAEKYGVIQLYTPAGKVKNHFPAFFSNNTHHVVSVMDMAILNNTIYVLIKDFGLKILNITDVTYAYFTDFEFKHPYLKKLDVHYNPYRDFTYVGILVSDRFFEEGHEFFFELKVVDEFRPVVNRYYLDSEFLDLNYFISDDKFSYLYEHFSNSIYVVIRSNVIDEYNSVYKIQIPELHNKKVDEEIFFVTNNVSGKPMVGILTEDEIVLIEDIRFTNAILSIKFLDFGKYYFDVLAKIDYCEGVGDEIYRVTDNVYYCSVNMWFEFNVNRNPSPFYDTLNSNLTLLYIFTFSVGVILILICVLFCRALVPFIINLMRDHKYKDMAEQPEDQKPPTTQENQIELAKTEEA